MSGQDLSASTGIPSAQITGVVLAGGRGMRMGGLEKGLQLFEGVPLAQHALQRLQPQVGQTLLNANRHLDQYRAFGAPVWPDETADYAGPLAGFITALRHCDTSYLVTVPCDAPLFPADLVQGLAHALVSEGCEIAMASAPEEGNDGRIVPRPQPVFCLLRVDLLASLERYVAEGGRKAGTWAAQHKTAIVTFDAPAEFANINTLAELKALQPPYR